MARKRSPYAMGIEGLDVLDKACPRCKGLTVVYSGNYYCTNPDCDWALREGGYVNEWLESLIRARKARGGRHHEGRVLSLKRKMVDVIFTAD